MKGKSERNNYLILAITASGAYNGIVTRRNVKLSDQVRKAIQNCGVSRYRISMETGIEQTTLSKFMLHKRGLPMKTLDVLADFLRLQIVMDGPRKAAKGKKGR